MSYLNLLTNPYVLNVGVVGFSIAMGYLARNYRSIFFGSLFILVIYCLAFAFDDDHESFIFKFFLAVYSIVMAFASAGYLARRFKEWILIIN